MSSLLTATESDPDAGAFILVAGDLPTIGVTSIDAMVDLWNTEQPWAAVTKYRDRITHPFLLSRPCIDESAEVAGSKVLWSVLVDSQDDRVVHVVSDADAPPDINTPADYEALNRLP
jgi:CTP:molybdopterin cytidylyltransferase MocA